MPINKICVREVVGAERHTTIQDAARLMRQHHVGDLIVMEGTNGQRVPFGIVTDRDIVVSVVASALDPKFFTIGDLATQELVAAHEDQGVFECIQQMRSKGVRRMPVIDRQGGLVGIISVDDLIHLLAEEMSELARLLSYEQAREAQSKI